MNILNSNTPPLVIESLNKLEKKIGHPLPVCYRSFLEKYNGGVPDPNYFYIPDCEDAALVKCFLGIDRPHQDIFFWLNELDDLNGQFIPIGFDPGGNAIILDYLDGKIYYWDSARHFECSTDEENAYWIANSFEEFLKNLTLDGR